jgi:hypothetical protein
MVSEKEPKEGRILHSSRFSGFCRCPDQSTTKTKRLDQTAIAVVKAGTEGWWVANIVHGRWGVEEDRTVRIFEAVRDYQTSCRRY